MYAIQGSEFFTCFTFMVRSIHISIFFVIELNIYCSRIAYDLLQILSTIGSIEIVPSHVYVQMTIAKFISQNIELRALSSWESYDM